MSSDFDRALPFILRWEGGRVDDPADKGGRTNRGITQRTYDGWRQDQGLPRRDVWDADEEETKEIYRRQYWWVGRDLPWPLNLVVFDSAVLFGPGRAGTWLSAVSWLETPPEAQAWAILCLRRERHRENVARDKSQSRFWGGWMNRLTALAREAGLVPGSTGDATTRNP